MTGVQTCALPILAITTMTLLGKQTVGSGGASSISFTNIPQTYTDLKLVVSARGTASGVGDIDNYRVVFNGLDSSKSGIVALVIVSSASSYSYSELYAWLPSTGATSSTFSNTEFYIPNYSGSTYKSLSIDGVTEDNVTSNTGPYASLYAGLWSNSAPINSITLYPNGSANFAQYSTFYLYCISNSSTQNKIGRAHV